MEVDRCVDGFYPKSDTVIVEGVRCAQFVCCTAGSGRRVEGLIIIFSSAIIATELSDLIAPGSDTGIKGLVGSGASFKT